MGRPFSVWLLQFLETSTTKRISLSCQSQRDVQLFCQFRMTLIRTNHVEMLFVGCLPSQQQDCVSQGRICSGNCTCCHTEKQVADQTFLLTQSQYTDTGPTSPSTDPVPPGAWQGSHWGANFEITGMTRPGKKSRRKRDSNPGPSALVAEVEKCSYHD